MADEADGVRVALVAGATRGAGRAIAVELARAGFFVYATGRSSRVSGPSELDRPETIEETGELIHAAGGAGTFRVVDHEDPDAVAELVAAVEREQGRLDVLVNDIFGGDRYAQWDKPLWEHDWQGGLRMLQMGVHTHLITGRAAIPLMLRTASGHGTGGLVIEMTDGTSAANATFRRNVGFYYDLVKANVERIVKGLTAELENLPVTTIGVTPGWLRSEQMLDNFGVTEANWRDACTKTPGFAISESPSYVARGVAALARAGDAGRWAGTIISSRQLADAYDVADADGSRPDCWGYLAAYGWERDDGAGIDRFRLRRRCWSGDREHRQAGKAAVLQIGEVARLAEALAGVRRTSADGLAQWRYRGRLVARQLDDAHLVIRADFDYRDSLLRQFPETFSVPARYSKHMMVVADLAKGDAGAVEEALEAAWQLQRSAD
jgi:NAD(P)-dependent dehydrogenase (short-subunit alcohol dehydrogenase family)